MLARQALLTELSPQPHTLHSLSTLVLPNTICPSGPIIHIPDLKNLNDIQVQLGHTNWVRPWLKIIREQLTPLFKCLKDDPQPNYLRMLTPDTIQAIFLVNEALRTL